ncbi:RnfABCDGE type electron transport complex subunit B [bacterium]|nr:RnfABCDGE type electron transport complex subunit B [bacterium]
MDITSFVVSMSSMGGLGALFAIGLAIADKKLHVEVDSRIEPIIEELPGANCGGCGYPGCSAFAESIVAGKANITACPVNTQDGVDEISIIMGVKAESMEREIARILCKGGNNETAKKGVYLGLKNCIGAHLAFGGEKLCSYGCLGFADCVKSCPFDAIMMNDNGLPEVNEETCTGCGNCEIACPRNIIEIHPQSRNLFIFCRNQDEAKYTRSVCIKACNACKACVKKVEEGQIEIKNNLAVINYDIYGTVSEVPTDKCVNNSIGLLEISQLFPSGK